MASLSYRHSEKCYTTFTDGTLENEKPVFKIVATFSPNRTKQRLEDVSAVYWRSQNIGEESC